MFYKTDTPQQDKSLSSGGGSLPSYHQRSFAHNYHAPFIYHIIIRKQKFCEDFGEVRGDARIPPGQPGCAYIETSNLGKIISKSIFRISRQFPILQIYQFAIMPDHVHILLRVKSWSDLHLDYYIQTLVDNIACWQSSVTGQIWTSSDIFQPGYCDKPLLLNRNLDVLFRYIRENPHRLAVRKQFPQFFTRTHNLVIGDKTYEAYGNLFLLRNPDKEAVRISRHFSPEEVAQKRAFWLDVASKGGVLVSPFISPAEREVRSAAEGVGGRIILIVAEALGERFKPCGSDFALCADGRLAIVSLSEPSRRRVTREACLRMNGVAEGLACGTASRRLR